MLNIIEKRVAQLLAQHNSADLLQSSKMGLEKESLRVSPSGQLAQTPHPAVLGSALTHPYITTDYSEALMEFITPPLSDVQETLQFLCNTQKYVYEHLHNEFLWATSMPCVVAGETSIPLAQYGKSNAGVMKTVYRRGLGHRYGRVMQVIAGVHFNYSYSDKFWQLWRELAGTDAGADSQAFISSAYMGITRNVLRYGWIIPYLFGASPAVCKSFFVGKQSRLEEFDAGTFYQPYATSLRLGDIGYHNKNSGKTAVKVSYNSLAEYIDSLNHAITTPCPQYEKFGSVVNGEYQQLNSHLLQIENEYYSSIRPKQITDRFEKPITALKKRGIQYLELRSLDVNAYHPMGIAKEQMHFLELFVLYCLLLPSPPIGDSEQEELDHNKTLVAHQGRDPQLKLIDQGKSRLLREWALEIVAGLEQVARCFGSEKFDYQQLVAHQIAVIKNPELTPSARMLTEMRSNKEGFYQFALRMSQQHYDYYRHMQLPPEQKRWFDDLAALSWENQARLEREDKLGFAEFLQQYFQLG